MAKALLLAKILGALTIAVVFASLLLPFYFIATTCAFSMWCFSLQPPAVKGADY